MLTDPMWHQNVRAAVARVSVMIRVSVQVLKVRPHVCRLPTGNLWRSNSPISKHGTRDRTGIRNRCGGANCSLCQCGRVALTTSTHHGRARVVATRRTGFQFRFNGNSARSALQRVSVIENHLRRLRQSGSQWKSLNSVEWSCSHAGRQRSNRLMDGGMLFC